MLTVCQSGQKKCPAQNLCGLSVCVQSLPFHSPTPEEQSIFTHYIERYLKMLLTDTPNHSQDITEKHEYVIHFRLNPFPDPRKAPKCQIICDPKSLHVSAEQPRSQNKLMRQRQAAKGSYILVLTIRCTDGRIITKKDNTLPLHSSSYRPHTPFVYWITESMMH